MASQALLTPFTPLSLNEQVTGGWTHRIIIKAADCVAAGAVNTIDFLLPKVAVGSIVFNPSIYLVTPFVFSDATILTTTLSVGDGASATTFLAASNIAGTGQTTPVAAATVYVDTARVAAAYAVSTNTQLRSTITVTSAKNLSTCTAGEVHVFVEIRNLSELTYPQQ